MPEVVAGVHIFGQGRSSKQRSVYQVTHYKRCQDAKPIFLNDIGDIPEFLGDTGYLVDPDNLEQLTQKIV